MSLITLATVKEFLRISHTAEDVALQILLDAAEAFCAEMAGIHLCAGATYDTFTSEKLDGGGLYLFPQHLPIRTITSIVDHNDDDAVVVATEYFISEFLTHIERWADDATDGATQEWEGGRQRYHVTYTAGYMSTDLPASFKRAVMHYVYRDYHGRMEDGGFLWDPARDKTLKAMLLPCSLRRVIG